MKNRFAIIENEVNHRLVINRRTLTKQLEEEADGACKIQTNSCNNQQRPLFLSQCKTTRTDKCRGNSKELNELFNDF